ncbi:MAG: RluA family pseudouridine synthase [Pseudomonadota bacterium]
MDTEHNKGEELIEILLKVPQHYDGWRLDHFVHARIPRLSRSRIQRIIRGQLELGGVLLRPSMRVREGQEFVLLRPAPEEPDVPRGFDVLFKDEHLIAINKPAGLPVHATARFHKNTLTAVLREHFPVGHVPTIAHRLDRETSGLMLLCRSELAQKEIKSAFEKRLVHKRYLAIVHGFPGDEGVIDLPIGEDNEAGIRVKRSVNENGQIARTKFVCLDRRGEFSMVEAFPETGRQHQIRVHLAARSAPVVGDKLYGPDPSFLLEYLETGWTASLQKKLLSPRHLLHAADIQFVHPCSGKQMHLVCPMPYDMENFWNRCAYQIG